MNDFIAQLTAWTGQVAGALWGSGVTLLILLGTGLYLTLRMGLVQIRGFRHSVALISGGYDNPKHEGQISHFQALATALSATVGTGNIAGVATAISLGGPGALFWMWVTAFFGMATKFTECTLSMKTRIILTGGSAAGGPMYSIERGLGRRWKPIRNKQRKSKRRTRQPNLEESSTYWTAIRMV